jgi:Zn-finger protein
MDNERIAELEAEVASLKDDGQACEFCECPTSASRAYDHDLPGPQVPGTWVCANCYAEVLENRRKEIDRLRAELLAERLGAQQLRQALLRATDAINEGYGWHDESMNDDGDVTCSEDVDCDCPLPGMVNEALNTSAGKLK